MIALAGGRAAIAPRDFQQLLFGLGLATAMQFYTFDSVNLILPDMAGAFGATRDEASWILISYSAGLLFGTPLSSYLARRLGVRYYIIGSVLVFLAASICSSLSANIGEMIVFRGIEGFAGGTLNFWWRGSLYIFLSGPARSAAMMRISVMLYLATAAGLLVSGFLVDHLTWRYIWVTDFVLAAVALVLLLRHYPREALEPERESAPIDVLGVILLGIFLICMQLVFSRGPIDDWFGSSLLATLAWAAVIALTLFVFRTLSPANSNPFLRLPMVTDRNVFAAVLIGTCTGMILAGAIYALPEYLRGVDPQRYSASQTGEILCIYAIAGACLRPLVTKAVGRFGQRKVLVFALVSLIASMLLMARLLTLGTPAFYYALPLILYAMCLAPLLSAVASGTTGRVPGHEQIDAVSIYMTFRQFGTAMGVALVNVVITERETFHSNIVFAHLQQGRPLLHDWLNAISAKLIGRGGQSAIDARAAAVQTLHRLAEQQASVLAFADAFRVMALIGLIVLALVPLVAPAAKKP
jgi:DHA2 family multidrug resistance protein